MKKKVIIGIAALLVLCTILYALNALVIPKYITNPEGALTGEYYNHTGGHDVLFVGDCEVYESFVPAKLWEEYGITSYIRGSAQQLAWHSYYLLEETFKYEKPKVVVFNVLALKYGEPQSEAYNRMTFDSMKWSDVKYRAIKASMSEEENMLDYIFPLLRYHSRITTLEQLDFKYWFSDTPPVSDCGYLMQTEIVPMTEIPEEGGELLEEELPAESMKYLDMMRELCSENGSELVLVKAPTNSHRYWWYDEWDAQIVDYAAGHGLAYYNFIDKCEDMGIDWSVDTYDRGVHLNVYGAEKFTDYFGSILAESHGVADRRSESDIAESWQEHLRIYNERKEKLEKERDNK